MTLKGFWKMRLAGGYDKRIVITSKVFFPITWHMYSCIIKFCILKIRKNGVEAENSKLVVL
jgi:hypothetical protein